MKYKEPSEPFSMKYDKEWIMSEDAERILNKGYLKRLRNLEKKGFDK